MKRLCCTKGAVLVPVFPHLWRCMNPAPRRSSLLGSVVTVSIGRVRRKNGEIFASVATSRVRRNARSPCILTFAVKIVTLQPFFLSPPRDVMNAGISGGIWGFQSLGEHISWTGACNRSLFALTFHITGHQQHISTSAQTPCLVAFCRRAEPGYCWIQQISSKKFLFVDVNASIQLFLI